jgi:hypothetical protein
MFLKNIIDESSLDLSLFLDANYLQLGVYTWLIETWRLNFKGAIEKLQTQIMLLHNICHRIPCFRLQNSKTISKILVKSPPRVEGNASVLRDILSAGNNQFEAEAE